MSTVKDYLEAEGWAVGYLKGELEIQGETEVVLSAEPQDVNNARRLLEGTHFRRVGKVLEVLMNEVHIIEQKEISRVGFDAFTDKPEWPVTLQQDVMDALVAQGWTNP